MAAGDLLQSIVLGPTFGTGSPTPGSLTSVPDGSLMLHVSDTYSTALASFAVTPSETFVQDFNLLCGANNHLEVYRKIKVGTNALSAVTPTTNNGGDYYTGGAAVFEGPFDPSLIEDSDSILDGNYGVGDTVTTPSIAVAAAALLVAGIITNLSEGNISLPSGWTSIQNDDGGASHNSLMWCYRKVTAGSYSASWTNSGTGSVGQKASAFIMAFRLTGGGGGGPPVLISRPYSRLRPRAFAPGYPR